MMNVEVVEIDKHLNAKTKGVRIMSPAFKANPIKSCTWTEISPEELEKT